MQKASFRFRLTIATAAMAALSNVGIALAESDSASRVHLRANSIAFSPDDTMLAVVPREHPREIQLWGLKGRDKLRTFSAPTDESLVAIVFAPDSHLLAAAGDDASIFVWEIGRRDAVATLPGKNLGGPASQLVFSPDAKTLAAAYPKSGEVVVWDLTKKSVAARFAVPVEQLQHCSFIRDGQRLLLVFKEEVLVCDPSGRDRTRRAAAPAAIRNVHCSHDGALLAATTAQGIALWSLPDLATTEPLEYAEAVSALFTKQQRRLLVLRKAGDRYAIDAWDTAGRVQDATFKSSVEGLGSAVFALTSDQSRVAFADAEAKTVRIVPLTGGDTVVVGRDYALPKGDPVAALAFSRDSRYLAVSRSSGVVRLWDFASTVRVIRDNRHVDQQEAKLLTEFPAGMVTDLRFDSTLATVVAREAQGTIQLRSLRGDLPAARRSFSFHYSTGGDARINRIEFSPNGRWIAVVGVLQRVFLIDTATGDHRRLEATPFMMRFNQAGDKLLLVDRRRSYFYYVNTGHLQQLRQFGKPNGQSFQERLGWGVAVDEAHGIWDPNLAAPVAAIKPRDVQSTGLYAISPDRKQFAIVARKRDGSGIGVEVFGVKTSQRITYMPLDIKSFCAIQFTPDSSHLLIATADAIEQVNYRRRRTVQLLGGKRQPGDPAGNSKPAQHEQQSDAAALLGETVQSTADNVGPIGFTDRPPEITAMDVSLHGLIATGGPSGQVRFWDLATGKAVGSQQFTGEAVNQMRFADNGKQLAVVQHNRLYVMPVPTLARTRPTTETSQQR